MEAHCALIEQLAINGNATSNSELSVCQPAAFLIGPVIHCNVGNAENVSMELFDDLLISDNLRCTEIAHVKMSKDRAIESSYSQLVSTILR